MAWASGGQDAEGRARQSLPPAPEAGLGDPPAVGAVQSRRTQKGANRPEAARGCLWRGAASPSFGRGAPGAPGRHNRRSRQTPPLSSLAVRKAPPAAGGQRDANRKLPRRSERAPRPVRTHSPEDISRTA